MKKIPTLLVRDWDGDRRYVLDQITPGCEWVAKGEGTPTRKYDGTCVMFDGGQWWARREVKAGKPEPSGFVALDRDEETGKTVGWEPVEQSGFARWHADALAQAEVTEQQLPPGTYELVGPKVNGNPEGVTYHHVKLHADAQVLPDAPRDFDGLAEWLHAHPYEGIVWHHPDGRMAKIKKRDFPGYLVADIQTPYDDLPIEVRRANWGWFGEPWPSGVCYDDDFRLIEEMRKPFPAGESCLYCTEAFADGDSGQAMPLGRVDGTASIVHVHKECMLREVVGSMAHMEHRCRCYGADAGHRDRSRADALAVWEWVQRHGTAAL